MLTLPVIRTTDPITPLAPRSASQVRLGQFNAYNLFDTRDNPSTQDPIPTRAAYRQHLGKLALAIRDAMGAPDIVTMQEVENLKVLQDLVARPELAGLGYKALLREGTDPRGIDNGMIYRDTVKLTRVDQIDPARITATNRESHLFTRPPLVATFAVNGAVDARRGPVEITVIGAHFSSKLGQEDAAHKRAAQAGAVADYVTGAQAVDNRARIVVSGDLNMEYGEPEFAPLRNTRRAASLVSLVHTLGDNDQFSWRDGRTHMMLDHVLTTKGFAKDLTEIRIPHIDTQVDKSAALDPVRAEGVSDHDPIITTFDL